MKKKNLIIITTFIFCLLIFLINAEEKLEFFPLLPENNDILSYPVSICLDEKENIYVLDSGMNQIVKVNNKGKVIFQIEKDFFFKGSKIPLAVDQSGRIIVVDNGNLEVKIFDDSGKFSNKFKIPWTSLSIDTDSNGNIYLSMESRNKEDPLVAVFSPEGKYLKSFGQRLITQNPNNILSLNETAISITKDDEIFISFLHWPIIRKYTNQGKLIVEKIFNTENFYNPKYTLHDVLTEPNKDWAQLINQIILFSASSMKEKGVYFKLNGPWFLYFNTELELKRIFTGGRGFIMAFDLDKNNRIFCLKAQENNIYYQK